MSETKAGPQSPLRRKLLKIGAAVAVEAALQPISRTGEFLASQSSMLEGNPAQRLAALEKLSYLLVREPTEENKKLATAWIKFNLGEIYGFANNLPVSASMIRHFLYGAGQEVDISKVYQEAAVTHFRKYYDAKGMTDEEVMPNFLSKMLNYETNKFIKTVDPEDIKRIQSGKPPPTLRVRTLFHSIDDDLEKSMHDYTVDIEGSVISAAANHYHGFDIQLAHPSVQIYDRYDWDGSTNFYAETNVRDVAADFLKKLGVSNPYKKIAEITGEENAAELSRQNLTITDKDGALLTEKGFGAEFDIRGKFNVKKPVIFRLPDPSKLIFTQK